MRRAVDVFADMGKLNMAAKQLKDMAELYEKDDDKKNAMECYEQVRQSLCVFNCTHSTILLRMVCMCVCVCRWMADGISSCNLQRPVSIIAYASKCWKSMYARLCVCLCGYIYVCIGRGSV